MFFSFYLYVLIFICNIIWGAKLKNYFHIYNKRVLNIAFPPALFDSRTIIVIFIKKTAECFAGMKKGSIFALAI